MKIKKNQVISSLGLIILVFANLFFFQNCAPNKSNIENVSSTTGLVVTSSVRLDGQCSPTVNTCLAGTFYNVADSTTQSLWKCNGSGGGLNVLCSSNFSSNPVDGVCSPIAVNGCMQGKSNDLVDTAETNLWRCEGFNGGASVSCSLPRTSNQRPANGQCGPSKDTCNVGSFVDVADNSSQNLWVCRGILGAADANCSATIISGSGGGGLCGSTVNSCNSSATVSDLPDTSTNYFWRCTGSNGFYDTCYKNRPTCALTVQPMTHVGESYTYNITMSNGTLPASVKVKLFSSRTNPDGTGLSADADGSDRYTSTVNTPISISGVNNGGTGAGIYDRYYTVIDPSTNATLCTTNTVHQVLTPACSLSVSGTTVTTEGRVTFAASFPALGELPLPKSAFNVAWYGTKTVDNQTVNDMTANLISAASFPVTSATTAIGTYTRYIIARDNYNVELCRSNTVSYTVEAPPPPPAPVPVPAPVPTPTPVVYKDCSFNGQTVAHGSKVLAYTANRVNYGNGCDSASVYRNCNDGALDNPSASFATCTPDTVVKPISCRISTSYVNEDHCGANEVAQSLSVYSATYFQGNYGAKMMCCTMNVDLDASETPRYAGKGVGADNQEHVATCGTNEMMSGYSVATDGNGSWDGNWTVFCRAMTNKSLNTTSIVLGNASRNGITNYGVDNVYHSTTCSNGQFLSGLGLWATERLDNISREWCTGFPQAAVAPSPIPAPDTGGVVDRGGVCGGNYANTASAVDGTTTNCN